MKVKVKLCIDLTEVSCVQSTYRDLHETIPGNNPFLPHNLNKYYNHCDDIIELLPVVIGRFRLGGFSNDPHLMF